MGLIPERRDCVQHFGT